MMQGQVPGQVPGQVGMPAQAVPGQVQQMPGAQGPYVQVFSTPVLGSGYATAAMGVQAAQTAPN